MRVKCLAQVSHNTVSLAKARTQTICSGDWHTNHQATAPPPEISSDVIAERTIAGKTVELQTCPIRLRPNETQIITLTAIKSFRDTGQKGNKIKEMQDIWGERMGYGILATDFPR